MHQEGRGFPLIWFDLITFCLTRALAAALALALVITTASVAVALVEGADSAQASTTDGSHSRAVQGMITDSECGAKHDRALDKSPAECTRFCVRNGAQYVLVNGDQTYVLEGNTSEVDKFAGQRVQVSGSVSGHSIQVSSISIQ